MRDGSKPVASAPFLLLVDLDSFSFLRTPHEKTLGLEKFNHDNGLHAGLTGKFGKDAVRGTPQARCASKDENTKRVCARERKICTDSVRTCTIAA